MYKLLMSTVAACIISEGFLGFKKNYLISKMYYFEKHRVSLQKFSMQPLPQLQLETQIQRGFCYEGGVCVCVCVCVPQTVVLIFMEIRTFNCVVMTLSLTQLLSFTYGSAHFFFDLRSHSSMKKALNMKKNLFRMSQ